LKDSIAKYISVNVISGVIMDDIDIVKLEKLAQKNDPEALFRLSEVYRVGKHFKNIGHYKKDAIKSKELLSNAAKLGCKKAIEILEKKYSKSYKKLVQEENDFLKLKRDSNNGDPQALFEFGLLLLKGKRFLTTDLKIDKKQSEEFIQLASKKGHIEAQEYMIKLQIDRSKEMLSVLKKNTFQEKKSNSILEDIIKLSNQNDYIDIDKLVSDFTPVNYMLHASSSKRKEEDIFLRFNENNVKLIAFLFSRNTIDKNKTLISNNLDYFDKRSNNYIDIYCAGFKESDEVNNDGVLVGEKYWTYSDTRFDEDRRLLESETSWKFSGEIDLILVSVKRGTSADKVFVDYSQAIVCHLSELIEIKAFNSIEAFFEKLFQYAEYADPSNPIWNLSDKFGLRQCKSTLIKFVLSLLPASFSKDLMLLTKFALTDITKGK